MEFELKDKVIVNTPFAKGEAEIISFANLYCCRKPLAYLEFPSGFKVNLCQSTLRKKEHEEFS